MLLYQGVAGEAGEPGEDVSNHPRLAAARLYMEQHTECIYFMHTI